MSYLRKMQILGTIGEDRETVSGSESFSFHFETTIVALSNV